LNPLPAVADTPPLAAADCDPLAGLDAEGRHLMGLGVLNMARDLTAARRRIAELEDSDRAQRQRITLQRQTIVQLRRTAGADPAPVLAAIAEALGEDPGVPAPVEATPLPYGTVLGAVRADRAGLRAAPLAPPQTPVAATVEVPQVPDADLERAEVECVGPDCNCGLCPAAPLDLKDAYPGWVWRVRSVCAMVCAALAAGGLAVCGLSPLLGVHASSVPALPAAAAAGVGAALLRPGPDSKRGGGR